MHLRAATVDDLEVILHHRREMFREMGGHYVDAVPMFEDASRDYFDNALRNGSYRGLIGEIGERAMAGGGVVLAAWPGSPLNLTARRAWILNIYVEPEHRRRGFATRVMEALMEWCRENGFQSVALHASEYGRPLYEKLGFRSTNEMRRKF